MTFELLLPKTIDALFVALGIAIVWTAWRARIESALIAHLVFFLLLMQGLELSSGLGTERKLDLSIYVLSHVLVTAYLGGVVIVGLTVRKSNRRERMISTLAACPAWAWKASLALWTLVKAYLLGKYGPLAFYAMQAQLAEAGEQFNIEYQDVVLNAFVGVIASGGVLAFIARVVARPSEKQSPFSWLIVIVFLALYLLLGEAAQGARRTLALLAIFAVVGYMSLRRGEFALSWRRQWISVVALAAGIAFASAYYQVARNNVGLPEVVDKIASTSWVERASALLIILNPTSEASSAEPYVFLREGPFGLMYDVTDRVYSADRLTHGELLQLSLAKIVPRVLWSDKPESDIDEVIADRLDISPVGPFLTIDLSTSTLAILVADFGILGLIFASILAATVMLGLVMAMQKLRGRPSLVVLAAGYLLQNVANVEGSLVTPFSTVRDFVIFGVLLLLFEIILRTIRSAISRAVARPENGA